MLEPVISIVVPCYNGAQYLAGGIESIQAQNTPSEIIIVDDGSQDDSVAQACALVGSAAPEIFVVCQVNQGPAAARNLGLRLARGRYVCFLDVDDQYAPGFFDAALPLLENDPSAVAVFSELEFVDAHRPVEPWQKALMENSAPSNIIVRTATAREVGGFPVDRAFRGPAAGEDCCFRTAIGARGKVFKLHHPFLRYLVRRGSHFDFFLDRAYLSGGEVRFKFQSLEELDGSLSQAAARYHAAAGQQHTAKILDRLGEQWRAAHQYRELAERFESVPGFLQPFEGYVLHQLAHLWPAQGKTVEIGSFKGRSTCWLAAGCRAGNHGQVAAVDHFRGSPEHQSSGSHEDADIVNAGSTFPAFSENLRKQGLLDWVTPHVGSADEISQSWQEPIRLLFIDGDHSYEATSRDFSNWARFVVPHGMVALHDVNVWPGVTQFYEELRTQPTAWREFGVFFSVAVFQRLG